MSGETEKCIACNGKGRLADTAISEVVSCANCKGTGFATPTPEEREDG